MRRVVIIIAVSLLGLGVIAGGVVVVDYLADLFGGSGSRSRECAAIYTEDIQAVPGVASVNVICKRQLGGSTHIDVTLDTAEAAVAEDTARAVVKSLARDGRVEDAWLFPRKYLLSDGSAIYFEFYDEGLNLGMVGEAREKWGIAPTPERNR